MQLIKLKKLTFTCFKLFGKVLVAVVEQPYALLTKPFYKMLRKGAKKLTFFTNACLNMGINGHIVHLVAEN